MMSREDDIDDVLKVPPTPVFVDLHAYMART